MTTLSKKSQWAKCKQSQRWRLFGEIQMPSTKLKVFKNEMANGLERIRLGLAQWSQNRKQNLFHKACVTLHPWFNPTRSRCVWWVFHSNFTICSQQVSLARKRCLSATLQWPSQCCTTIPSSLQNDEASFIWQIKAETRTLIYCSFWAEIAKIHIAKRLVALLLGSLLRP